MHSNDPMIAYPSGQQATPGEAHLWVCSGKNIGRRFALDKPSMSIGRSEDADIVLVDERVSQQHAVVEVQDGQHVVRDLGSTNGTIVNNQRIEQVTLRDGDLLQVGETVFEYLSYQERNLTITVPGQNSNTATDAVPADLRNGARQMLQQARVSQVNPATGAPGTDPSVPTAHPQRTDTAVDVAAEPPRGGLNALPMQRPAQGFGPPMHPYGHGTVPPPHGGGAFGPPGMYPTVPPHMMVPGTAAPWEDRRGVVVDDDDEEEGGGFDPKMILERLKIARDIFLPYWKSVVFLALLGIGAGIGVYYLKPPKSLAVFQISLTRGLSQNPLGGSDSRSNVTFFKSAEISFRSSGLIGKTLTELGEPGAPDDRLASIQERLTFASLGPPIPNTYAGGFVDQSGDFALKFLKTHVQLYLETEVEKTLREIKASADFLEERLGEIDKDLKRTEKALTDFKKENIDGLPDQARDTYTLLFDLQRQESAAVMELSRVRASLGMVNDLLRTEKPIIPTKVQTSNGFQSAIVDANQQLARERAAGKGPEHPDIVRLEKRLVQLRELAKRTRSDPTMTEEATNPNYVRLQDQMRQLTLQEQAARKQLGFVRKELDRVKNLVNKLPELEATHAELTRSYGSMQKLYRQMHDELSRTNLQLEIERAQAKARYDIITAPKIEYIDVTKLMMKRAGMGAVAGLIFGLLLAGLRKYRSDPDKFVHLIKGPPELEAPPEGGAVIGPATQVGALPPGGTQYPR